VLEHLLDPAAVLRQLEAALKPSGALYIEVPNIPAESLLGYPDHKWAPRYDEPHITFFSLATLRGLLESVGFELGFCDTAGPEYKYISALQFRLPPSRSFLQGLLPPGLFLFLRKQRLTKPFRVQEREHSFYQYEGFRIWIRSVWRKTEPSCRPS
jgi:SAM-dependent methyltransferase